MSLLLALLLYLTNPDAVVHVVVTYVPFGTSESTAVPDGTPVNLYLDGHLVARDETEKGQAYFETSHGNFVVDAVLGRADRLRWWVCRRGITVNEQNEFFEVQCTKVFLLFYPFILPGRD
jgi:hypothetical protein